jgi:DNA modification methylase
MNKTDKVICLGKEFNSEEERREYFRDELRIKLPELKNIEGFPIGEDEDIINLSDPPYYTACPNPWINEFIAHWEKEKETIAERKSDFQVDEPYASDVSEGKNNPIYNAHSYHTKVPHPAIMRYILHYTQPGDIVFDGFAGTGMTGVAASYCNNTDEETKFLIDREFQKKNGFKPLWGERKAILNDLSPIATFISKNYNSNCDEQDVLGKAENLLGKLESDLGWLYRTKHSNGTFGRITNIIWSEVLSCPNCNSEIIYHNVAVDNEKSEVMDVFVCDSCGIELTKQKTDTIFVTSYDSVIQEIVKHPKYVPVLLKYEVSKKKHQKKLDKEDYELIDYIDKYLTNNWSNLSTFKIPKGDKTNEFIRKGFLYSHQCYFNRSLVSLLELQKLISNDDYELRLIFTSICQSLSSILVRYNLGNRGNGPMSGTIYVPSLIAENNIFKVYSGKVQDFVKAFKYIKQNNVQRTGSATHLTEFNTDSFDYIFTDPPFGANLMYSDLNFLWESWLKLFTNTAEEAIQNKTQKKGFGEYADLMTLSFSEFYRVLKPGKWMTVEFSNTNAAVWNGIQTSLQKAGFIVANVAGLDKKQGSYNAVMNATSVKQDLVISCYKPSSEFEVNFHKQESDVVIWDFISEHLQHLPSHIKKENSTTAIIERSPKILYDRLITFYLMRGLPVPIDSRAFQEGLKQRFVERDGMYFIAEQAAEYDEKKAKSPNFVQLSLIVTNESDAIEWLKDRLRKQAQKYQDIMPDFRIATQSLRKGDTLPELQDILNESFIQDVDGKWRTPDPNEAKDRDALRSKVLLKEFTGYVTAINLPKAKKLKEVRVEALRAGFKNSWEQKDFKTIVSLGDMIPQNILLEDEQLLMYYDIAKDRV